MLPLIESPSETLNLPGTATCNFCGAQAPFEDVEIDSYQKGFWCTDCDGYNYFSPERQATHRFTLIIEDKASINMSIPNTKLKLNKRISPLRYPGGKSRLANFIASKLQANSSRTLVSPFAGGASVELSLLEAGVIEQLILNDLDFGVYSLFWTIQNAPYELEERIKTFTPSHNDFFIAQDLIKNDYAGCTIFEAAWSLLLVNRLAYSGIYKANPLGGRRGMQHHLLSRWNPKNLIMRIRKIHSLSRSIQIFNKDACDIIEEMYWSSNTTMFLDPPYVQKGKQLYRCFYEENDHIKLNVLLESLYQGFPGADIILCYDNDPFIKSNYIFPEVEKISRAYSI
ncbi:DNA adenine methylase [Mesobacillus zeae]|uniref:DNA adenine methylase n=1 Tax=Mesobacillus zeae TaxID=1917180 RepID=UPI003009D7D9